MAQCGPGRENSTHHRPQYPSEDGACDECPEAWVATASCRLSVLVSGQEGGRRALVRADGIRVAAGWQGLEAKHPPIIHSTITRTRPQYPLNDHESE